ncbi:Alpha/beta hydrolase family protein [Maioricimonas rarisocia]|uniref:Alpha/beta hydrolase family protein n=1 Tax=Maioricimonas rarisocia TaxID=2528026 RepID=A0A517Z385_9PLAN|nr:prolyl oligopeptidase family serine peptidase [Maioricimonas rarisocia]QDU36918.1 Alpha/beta hydrolase family protein [Maioricimonas rarisocia]
MPRIPTRATLTGCLALLLLTLSATLQADDAPAVDTSRGDDLVTDYFQRETRKLEEATFAGIETLEEWEAKREEFRGQLFEMLGLDPLPEKTPLEATITGTVDHDDFTVERVHFQSRPGLYVTGNLYVPKGLEGKAPAVLYVCGHGRVKKDGISYGNKTYYHYHGSWFARHGYVCLTIDTLQLGEIEGIHHGTYRHDMFWWNARGYTPAGVEAWNCIRALDYLQSRAEVDPDRLGVTGRSGGGAYSWWIAALDERIKVAVPVAGITNLKNHVIDGCVEGHCDCMFQVNTYRWDYPMIAALVAPRPLLISNTDKDGIFPLDGVVDVYMKVRPIYELYGKAGNLGLHITEGPHKDTQQLRVHAFQWMNRHLKGEEPLIDKPAVKYFEPEELRVFDELPNDEQNTSIHETFVAKAETPTIPQDEATWKEMREGWMSALREKSFRGFPEQSADDVPLKVLATETQDGVTLMHCEFMTQEHYPLPLYVAFPADTKPEDLDLTVLNVLDQQEWEEFVRTTRVGFPKMFADSQVSGEDADGWNEAKQMFGRFKWGMAYVAPRGIGPTEWSRDERERTHIRRRFMLLGQTADGMRVWDTVQAILALRQLDGISEVPLWLQGERNAAGWALYASLFSDDIARLDLWHLPKSHRDGPIFLNVLRFLDIPQAVAMAAESSQVVLYEEDRDAWAFPRAVADALDWGEEQVQVRTIKPAGN